MGTQPEAKVFRVMNIVTQAMAYAKEFRSARDQLFKLLGSILSELRAMNKSLVDSQKNTPNRGKAKVK